MHIVRPVVEIDSKSVLRVPDYKWTDNAFRDYLIGVSPECLPDKRFAALRQKAVARLYDLQDSQIVCKHCEGADCRYVRVLRDVANGVIPVVSGFYVPQGAPEEMTELKLWVQLEFCIRSLSVETSCVSFDVWDMRSSGVVSKATLATMLERSSAKHILKMTSRREGVKNRFPSYGIFYVCANPNQRLDDKADIRDIRAIASICISERDNLFSFYDPQAGTGWIPASRWLKEFQKKVLPVASADYVGVP